MASPTRVSVIFLARYIRTRNEYIKKFRSFVNWTISANPRSKDQDSFQKYLFKYLSAMRRFLGHSYITRQVSSLSPINKEKKSF